MNATHLLQSEHVWRDTSDLADAWTGIIIAIKLISRKRLVQIFDT